MAVVVANRPRFARAQVVRLLPLWARLAAIYLLLVLALAGLERASFRLAQVPVSVRITPSGGTFTLDDTQLRLTWTSAPTAVTFVASSPTFREFQLDGSDSANNFSEDPTYIGSIAASPYFRFQAWMRDVGTYSSWQDLAIRQDNVPESRALAVQPGGSPNIALPRGQSITLTARVARLEAPARLVLMCAGVPCADLTIDRNSRQVRARTLLPDGTEGNSENAYFPTQPLPFLADLVNLLAHVALWSLALLGAVALLHAMLILAIDALARAGPTSIRTNVIRASRLRSQVLQTRPLRLIRPRDCWDVATALTLAASFAFTVYVSLVQFAALPHILDASAYYFQAKIFASGQLSVPAPRDLATFQGPFMVAHNGRWFAQYAPGTSAVLALGMLLHAPGLVEPVLGALSLLGVYRIGRMLFTPFEAWLAVLFGALSPFYTYLAASYLSHAVALFFGVYFILYVLRFERSHSDVNALLAAGCLGALLLTRELDAVLLGLAVPAFVVVAGRHRFRRDRWRVAGAALGATAVVACAFGIDVLYNWLQSGDMLLFLRTLFSPSDRYGFGVGVGFYGQHTLAAGLVNLDQQLTILLIDLFGWPFYLTVAVVPLAFLRRLRTLHWDTFCLVLVVLFLLAQIGYFYHGIYLGPRYLFGALPFLLLLTARGATGLYQFLVVLTGQVAKGLPVGIAPSAARSAVGGALALLIACTVVYYLPRQLQMYTGYTGLPAALPVRRDQLIAFRPSGAIIVTDSWYVYYYILWPLNDPDLSGPTLWADATTPQDLAALQTLYPDRTLYQVAIAPDGSVSFTPVTRTGP